MLRNATPAALPPYVFKENGTELTGIVTEMTAAVGDVLGIKIETVDTPFPGIMPALKADRADIVWSVMTDTPEREEELDFVNYFLAPAGFMTPKGNPENINTIDDICGLRMGTLKGNSKLPMVEEQSKKCEAAGEKAVDIKLYDKNDVGQTQLRSGNLDFWFGGKAELAYLAKAVDDGSVFEVSEATVGHTAYGVGVLKGNDELVQAVQGAIKEIMKSGEYDKILAKWSAESGALEPEGVIVNGAGQGVYK